MEVKVSVDGVPRVVCGVTGETTCQGVVFVLAQATGQPGRYVLREKFKDFERCMLPDERLLETLKKYGEQAKEVQLILQHNTSPPSSDETGKTKTGRYQPCQPLKRKDVGARMRRGSGSLILHRQSLPPLSCLTQEADQKQKDPKRPKRKSLTLMEEARDWLDSLGKGKVYSTASDKESRRKTDKKNRHSFDLSFTLDKDNSGRSSGGKDTDKTKAKPDADLQTACRTGTGKNQWQSHEARSGPGSSSITASEDEKDTLRETILRQLLCLRDLRVHMTRVDQQIRELEDRQGAKTAEQEAYERMVDGEVEQIKFWENELRAEEGHEKDLQRQFLEMRAKAAECKAKLEQYRRETQGLEFFSGPNSVRDESETANAAASPGTPAASAGRESGSGGNVLRKFPPKEDFHAPHARVPPNQTRERRLTGPTELREWWARWSEARNSQPLTKHKAVHRSELTIYLKSTKV